jgi:hypothetical protein
MTEEKQDYALIICGEDLLLEHHKKKQAVRKFLL